MATVSTPSNHYKFQKANKQIDLDNDVIKVILMNTTFTFDKDAHATLADVTADQLATGNGYTQDNKTLANQVLTEDDTNDRAVMTADDVTFTASGGTIGPTGAAILYDDTTSDDTVIGCIDFGVNHEIGDTDSLVISTIVVAEV